MGCYTRRHSHRAFGHGRICGTDSAPQPNKGYAERQEDATRVAGEGGSSKYILGGDLQGRDILSRIIQGSGVSLTIAVWAISLGMIFGPA